jgi:hypothetical protein
MPFQTLELPAGTEVTRTVPIARNGDWSGLTRVRITSSADATIHSWEFINVSENDSKIRYRRVATNKGANNWYNMVLKKDQELGWWAARLESLCKLTYTATAPISFIYETQVGGFIAQLGTLPIVQWNKQADAKPWVTNLSLNNPTERHLLDGTRDAMGVIYWKPRV